ncbi:MAG: NAD(P)H-dependent oxidoreductase subunit E [Rhizomicrobium sp.]|jgi:formate dehydrogenase subunit gamma
MNSSPQPPRPSAWDEDLAREIIARQVSAPGGLLPALQALQYTFGFISKPAIALLAHAFNVTRAEVFGVASFYHDFRLDHPAGRHVLKLCRAEACQAVGAVKLADATKAHLKASWHETTADGAWTLEPVFCLGLCASGPAALIDGEPIGGLDESKLFDLLDNPPP